MAKLLCRSPVSTKTGLPRLSQYLMSCSRSSMKAVQASSLFSVRTAPPPTCGTMKFTEETTKMKSASLFFMPSSSHCF